MTTTSVETGVQVAATACSHSSRRKGNNLDNPCKGIAGAR
jgi:hypothetical protein